LAILNLASIVRIITSQKDIDMLKIVYCENIRNI